MSARQRWRTVLVVVLGLLWVGAVPAIADPAGPTHYDAVVEQVEPADAPVEVEILGGDAFLVLRATPGTTVEVPGYEGEPYVRIESDGTVLVNERSPARWLNDARYGELEVDLPAQADAGAQPLFVEVARDGIYAWHDHRIHFMSPSLPAQVDPAAGTPQPVMDWEVPLTAEGQDVVVRGALTWYPGPSPLVTALLLVLALAGAAAVISRAPGTAPALSGLAAIVGLGVGLATSVGLPPGADGEPMLLVLPGITLALLALAALLVRRGDVRARLLAAAAGVPLAVSAVLQLGALWRPIVPGPLPVGAIRITVVLAAAAGLAALGATVRGLLAATDLDAQDPQTT